MRITGKNGPMQFFHQMYIHICQYVIYIGSTMHAYFLIKAFDHIHMPFFLFKFSYLFHIKLCIFTKFLPRWKQNGIKVSTRELYIVMACTLVNKYFLNQSICYIMVQYSDAQEGYECNK